MIRVILDYDKEPYYCGSTLWFDDLDETFDFIRKQNFNSYHTFHITDEKTIEQFEHEDEEREKNDATGLC